MAKRIAGNVKLRSERAKVYASVQYLTWLDLDGRLSDFDRKQASIALGYVLAHCLKDLQRYEPYRSHDT